MHLRRMSAVLIALLLWVAGLLVFIDRVVDSTPAIEPDTPHDAIVVLTGASDQRLKEGMRLLERRKGDRLLISGVDRKVRRSELLDVTDGSKRLYDCCVDLGFDALNTVGNAKEISIWARAKGYRKIIVVTSDYHMPRALLEIKGEFKDATLTPYAVATPDLDARKWWKSPKAIRVLVIEYSKFLAILARDGIIRLSSLFTKDDATALK
jgi:uncharacterized SAM-binding protein YcdF (DUF218 family)